MVIWSFAFFPRRGALWRDRGRSRFGYFFMNFNGEDEGFEVGRWKMNFTQSRGNPSGDPELY